MPQSARKKPTPPTAPLTAEQLLYHDQKLTESRRIELFDFCADEYKKRHKRAWRFVGGKIIHYNQKWAGHGKGYHLAIPRSAGDLRLAAIIPAGETHTHLEHFFVWVVNEAADLRMTF